MLHSYLVFLEVLELWQWSAPSSSLLDGGFMAVVGLQYCYLDGLEVIMLWFSWKTFYSNLYLVDIEVVCLRMEQLCLVIH